MHKSDAWGGLRLQLAELQSALGDPDAVRKPEIFRDLWEAVDEQVCPDKHRLRCKLVAELSDLTALLNLQVTGISQKLYQNSSELRLEVHLLGDDVFQAVVTLLTMLARKHDGCDTWNLKALNVREQVTEADGVMGGAGTVPPSPLTQAELARSAHSLELLLAEPERVDDVQLVFIKTFHAHEMKIDERKRMSMFREIRVCSTEQPNVSHPNVCGISLATHAAAVETLVPGFGRLGLRGRMPFVALEYCNGVDLWDFARSGFLPHEKNGEMQPGQSPGVLALSKRIRQKLKDLLDACPRETRQKTSGDAEMVHLNQLLDAAASYQVELARLFEQVYQIFVPKADRENTKLEAYITAWSIKYNKDITANFKTATSSDAVTAGRALRRLLELVHGEEWEKAELFLASLAHPATTTNVTTADLVLLQPLASVHDAVRRRLDSRIGKVLVGNPLGRIGPLNSREEIGYTLVREQARDQLEAALKVLNGSPLGRIGSLNSRVETGYTLEREKAKDQLEAALQFENTLFEHVTVWKREQRLELHSPVKVPEHANVSSKIYLAIFQQAVEAISTLHKNHIIHGDIKAENFVLTQTGQVRNCLYQWYPRQRGQKMCVVTARIKCR
jgi:hypothetical protein